MGLVFGWCGYLKLLVTRQKHFIAFIYENSLSIFYLFLSFLCVCMCIYEVGDGEVKDSKPKMPDLNIHLVWLRNTYVLILISRKNCAELDYIDHLPIYKIYIYIHIIYIFPYIYLLLSSFQVCLCINLSVIGHIFIFI